MALANDDVIKTFPSDRADQPLRISVLPRRPRRDGSVANAHGPNAPDEGSAIRAVAVAGWTTCSSSGCGAQDVYLKGYADGREAHSGISEWFGFYNNTRPHQALGNRTPMAVWREGISGGLPETAVDMTLRLDNAKALPTCPQQQQQIAA
jgi:Integrase core domain